MLDYVSRLKELLDYFTFMHDKTSISLIRAILPLIKFSRELQDYIILVVRKAMFSREDTVRIAATNAIIDLFIVDKKSKKPDLNSLRESSSQASCSQQADIPSMIGGGLFHELSGLLRRCLCQQATVKEIMYNGLMKVVVLDPATAGSVFDFLWPHFLSFYIEDAEFPIRIDSCYKSENGKFSLVEPLDFLLSCVSWILLLQPHGEFDHPSESPWPCFGFSLSQENESGRTSSGESFSNALSKIRKSLIKCKLADGLGQSQDPGSRPLTEEKNFGRNLVLLGIIEVFVNIVSFDKGKATAEENKALEKDIMELIDLHDYFESDLNKQVTGIRKGSSKNITQDIPAKVDTESKEYPRASLPKLTQYRKSFFATSSLHQLLVTSVNLYSFNSLNNQTTSQCHSQSSSKNLDRCLKLISFTVKACLRHLKSFNALGSEVGGDPANTIVFGDVRKLGRPIIQLVWLLSSGPKPEKDRKKKEAKGKKNVESKGDQLFVSLQCLNELFKIKFSDSQLTELVEDFNSLAAEELDSEIDGARVINDNQDLMIGDQIVKSMHIFLEKRVKPLYSRLMALSLFQESEVLSELLLNIGKSLLREQRDYHGAWAVDISRSSKVENQSSARSVVALVTGLLPAPIDLIVAHEMGSELLKVMGSENRDPEEASGTFTVINYSTRNATATVLMQLVESCIVDLDWALVKLKAFSAFHNESTGAKENNQFGERPPGLIFEEAIYARSEALVYLLSSFTDMNLKDSQGEQLLRLTARFYKLLSRMTRLRIAPKGCKQLLPGQKFQKLAEVTCKELTSPLYNFVAMVQRIQQENAQSRGIISKIKRENRCIPDLIFQIEDYERYLIQLSKVTKVNLLRQAKRSTARDFKIGEVKKVPVSAEAPEGELRQEHSLSSDGESGEGTEGPDQEDGCEKIVSPECSGGREGGDGVAAAEDSESEEDDQEMPMRKKRVRMTKVVQDSDEE